MTNPLEAEFLELLGTLHSNEGRFPMPQEIVSEIRNSIEEEGDLRKMDDRADEMVKSVLGTYPAAGGSRERDAWTSQNVLAPMYQELTSSAAELGLSLPIPAYAGVYPTGSFNAQAVRTQNGALLLINRGLMMFIYQSVKLFTISFSIQLKDQDGVTLKPKLAEEEVARWLADLVVAYLFLGASTFSRRFPTEGGVRGAIIYNLARSTEKFVLAHEYGHAVAGHLTEPKSIRRALPNGELELVEKSWTQEFEADYIGLRLLIPPSKSKIEDDGNFQLMSMAMAGPFIFFAFDELINAVVADLQGTSTRPRVLTDHPPSDLRTEALRHWLQEMGGLPLLGMAEGFTSWLAQIRPDICQAVRTRLLT